MRVSVRLFSPHRLSVPVAGDQPTQRNPFGMDEQCQRCPALCDTRDHVVHGYGDVTADFLFVATMPSDAADTAGVPLVGDQAGERFHHILGSLGLNNSHPQSTEPELENAYITTLTRCRHPDRGPTETEIQECEPYLNAEIRKINPEILTPVGDTALTEIATEYTTTPATTFDIADDHATSIRGRGFELVPMRHPETMNEADVTAFIDHFDALMARDYRQTKGRRNR